mgnify:FL=1
MVTKQHEISQSESIIQEILSFNVHQNYSKQIILSQLIDIKMSTSHCHGTQRISIYEISKTELSYGNLSRQCSRCITNNPHDQR